MKTSSLAASGQSSAPKKKNREKKSRCRGGCGKNEKRRCISELFDSRTGESDRELLVGCDLDHKAVLEACGDRICQIGDETTLARTARSQNEGKRKLEQAD